MSNYLVVLFKNKKRKKIIKKFVTLKKAKNFFEKKVEQSNSVEFEVLYENGKECKYEIGLIEMSNKQLIPVYMTDEFGRNIKVKLEDDGMTLIQISKYKKEELIFDLQKKIKISLNIFLKTYLKGDEVKMVFSLNNKVVVQHNEKFFLFSLKNKSESDRLIDCLIAYHVRLNKSNCIFVKDNSKPQRKYLLNLLHENGVDKNILYRSSTTHPR